MKKTIIAIFLIALTLAQNSIFDSHLKEQNFLNFSKRNGKRYTNLEESLYRFSIYKDNIKSIENLNKENPNATFAENKFTDLTQEEFLAKFGGAKVPTQSGDRKLDSEHLVRNLGSYPPSLDLRPQKGMQPIRYQGQCGSCWAFAAASSIEYAFWKKTNYAGDLSEQHLVDCVYGSKGGCQGGWMPVAYDYIKNYLGGGISWEWDYPYEAKNGACRADGLKNKQSVWLNRSQAYQQVASDDASIKSALANVGVLSVCVDAYGWSYYQSGIYIDTRLSDQRVTTNCSHAVNIVGYGTENGIPYYIIRNSWDTWWGEKGYIRMDARRHLNGNLYSGLMLSYAFYPIIF